MVFESALSTALNGDSHVNGCQAACAPASACACCNASVTKRALEVVHSRTPKHAAEHALMLCMLVVQVISIA